MPVRKPDPADLEKVDSCISVTWGQLKEGGRQTAASGSDVTGDVFDGTQPDGGAVGRWASNAGRRPMPDAQQDRSILQDMPVLAAISGSLQQSATTWTNASDEADAAASCFMGHVS